MKVSAQFLSSSLSGCGRKLVGFALKVQVSGDLWSPAVAWLDFRCFVFGLGRMHTHYGADHDIIGKTILAFTEYYEMT